MGLCFLKSCVMCGMWYNVCKLNERRKGMLLNKLFVWVEVLERNEMLVSVYVCEEGKEKNFFGWVVSGFNDEVLKVDFEDYFKNERDGFFEYDDSGVVDDEEFEGERGFFEDIGKYVCEGVVFLDVCSFSGLSVFDGVVDDSCVFEEIDVVVLEDSEFEGVKVSFCEKLGIIKIEK